MCSPVRSRAARLRLRERLGQRAREAGRGADVLHLPPLGERRGEVRDDAEQRVELLALPAGEVVGRQQVERDHGDPQLRDPLGELDDLRGAGPVPVRGGLEAGLPGPPAVAVEDHRDVLRQGPALEVAAQPPPVEPVDRPAHSLTRHRHAPTVDPAASKQPGGAAGRGRRPSARSRRTATLRACSSPPPRRPAHRAAEDDPMIGDGLHVPLVDEAAEQDAGRPQAHLARLAARRHHADRARRRDRARLRRARRPRRSGRPRCSRSPRCCCSATRRSTTASTGRRRSSAP